MAAIKNIVVVGSGGGGVPLVQTLQKQINPTTHQIIVIEKRDYYAHWPALIRASVTDVGSIDERGLVPNDRAFDSTVKVIRSDVKQITHTEVITESGQVIPYEHLVLATGSIWNGPLALPDKRDKAVQHFKSFQKQLAAAEHVLIVGGGSVGLEYAGEIQHYYPDKKIVIIHGGSELMNKTYPTKFRRSLLDAMTKKGTQVILGDKISPDVVPQDGYVTTQSGRRIRADLVIPAAGGRPNTAVVNTLDADVVTKTGTVLVTPELRVKLSSGARNIWAIGDIIEWPEQKMVFKAAYGHAPTVVRNILASIQDRKETQYGGKPEMIFVTLGPKGGRGLAPFFGGIVLGDCLVSKMKSSGLFVDKTRGSIGY
ncbi:hypothetical protein ACGC1H_001269 [Rhizoctonia solani]|uniref:FAD/NAD(P)-binding domain-containing protein n=1 Tax=Rhizoctonia solani TaxID=456999 RepID=A0A8H2XMT3_9AGAM|nr:unnamed protein product [Rhizoctonia solani]